MNQATLAILTGPKEGGKTHTAKQVMLLHPRIVAVEWRAQLALSGCVDVTNDMEFLKAVRANADQSEWLIRYAPAFDPEAGSETVARFAYTVGGCCVIFDEAHAYMRAGKMGPWMGRLVREARHAGEGSGANVVFASPQLTDIATAIRTQADCWIVCGSLWTARDLDVLEAHTSPEFRSAAEQPLGKGAYRQIGFDTKTRESFIVTSGELRQRFRQ